MMKKLANTVTAINLVLAFNFFPLVPFLGWLNYGHADWATAWIPDVVMLLILPAAYFLYWHAGFVLAIAAVTLTWLALKPTDARGQFLPLALNGGSLAMYVILRAAYSVLDIHPDIV
jgi:hypothetical protein